MRRILLLVGLVMLAPVADARAQSMGTITLDAFSMPVTATVAVLDTKGTTLIVYLLPFEPAPADVAKLQADDSYWLLGKASPDPKWAACPYAKLELDWSDAKAAVGDVKQASLSLFSYNVANTRSSVSGGKSTSSADLALAGIVKPAQAITLTAKFSDPRLGSWDLKLKPKVLASTKKP